MIDFPWVRVIEGGEKFLHALDISSVGPSNREQHKAMEVQEYALEVYRGSKSPFYLPVC